MSQSCSNNLELTGSTYSLLRNAFPFLHSSLQPLLGTTTTAVLAQPEMEKRRFPLVKFPPPRGGDFQGMGSFVPMPCCG